MSGHDVGRRTAIVGGRSDTGQTVPVVVLFMAVLLGFCGVVIDGGGYLLVRRDMQGTADAAAMAAVRELPGNALQAEATALDYTEVKNDDGASLGGTTLSEGNTRIKVEVEKNATSPFMSFFGMTSPTITATATAEIAQVIQLDGMLPFAALEGSLSIVGSPPPMVAIKVAAGAAQTGNFGAVAPYFDPPQCQSDPTGASGHRDEITGAFGPGGEITCGPPVGETLDTKTGNMVTPTMVGFNLRFGSSDGTHSDLFADVVHLDPATGLYIVDKPESPRIGYIPVVTDESGAAAWPSGGSGPMVVVEYVMVYIGKIGTAGEPAYTQPQGNQVEVWVTPIPGQMPPNLRVEVSDDWEVGSMAPVVTRLVE